MGLSELTPEVDVYAFAMTCIEILSMGRVPWSLVGDDSVRHFVLSTCWCCHCFTCAHHSTPEENSRPLIPITPYTKPGEGAELQELMRNCWHRDPKVRPEFSTIVKDLKSMRLNEGVPEDVISPKFPDWTPLPPTEEWDRQTSASPDLHPVGFVSGSSRECIVLD